MGMSMPDAMATMLGMMNVSMPDGMVSQLGNIGMTEEEIKGIFDQHDTDNNSTISPDEFTSLMESTGSGEGSGEVGEPIVMDVVSALSKCYMPDTMPMVPAMMNDLLGMVDNGLYSMAASMGMDLERQTILCTLMGMLPWDNVMMGAAEDQKMILKLAKIRCEM